MHGSGSSEYLLASPSEILSVLARFADSSRRHSAQHRHDYRFMREAMSTLLPMMADAGQAALRTPIASSASIPASARHSAPGKSTTASGISIGQQRQYCQCGGCKWCLDNARWERVFEEKFADPTYYGSIRIRHNSTLADAR